MMRSSIFVHTPTGALVTQVPLSQINDYRACFDGNSSGAEGIYPFVQDPGHGWVAVPLEELAELAKTNPHLVVSRYSYQEELEGQIVCWLEEDCDAPRWLAAKGLSASRIDRVLEIVVESTHIRSLPGIMSQEAVDA